MGNFTIAGAYEDLSNGAPSMKVENLGGDMFTAPWGEPSGETLVHSTPSASALKPMLHTQMNSLKTTIMAIQMEKSRRANFLSA